jgi:hypothetical protein
VILPRANRKAVGNDVLKEVRMFMQSVNANTVGEELDAAFGPDSLLCLSWYQA